MNLFTALFGKRFTDDEPSMPYHEHETIAINETGKKPAVDAVLLGGLIFVNEQASMAYDFYPSIQ